MKFLYIRKLIGKFEIKKKWNIQSVNSKCWFLPIKYISKILNFHEHNFTRLVFHTLVSIISPRSSSFVGRTRRSRVTRTLENIGRLCIEPGMDSSTQEHSHKYPWACSFCSRGNIFRAISTRPPFSHSGTLGYRYTGEFCTADDETSININRRRWSVGGPLSRGRFPSALESNELDHVTMQFLRNPLFKDERHRLTVS